MLLLVTLKVRLHIVFAVMPKVFLLTFFCLNLSQFYWVSYVDHLINQNTLTMISQKLGFQINKSVTSQENLNINLILEEKELLSSKGYTTNVQNLLLLIKGYLDFCFSFSLKQIIFIPSRVTSKTSFLIGHVLTNSSQKVNQCSVIELGISAHDLVYCTRKTPSLKPNKRNIISIRSMKNYTKETFFSKED